MRTRNVDALKLLRDVQNKMNYNTKFKKQKKKISRTKTSKSNANRMIRLEKRKENEKKRRLKIKEDPEAYDKYLEAARKRYHNRKARGEQKLRSELTQRDRRMKRQRDENYQRQHRLKKKSEESIPTSDVSHANPSHQAVSAKKKSKKRIRTCYDGNSELRSNNAILGKKVQALKKQVSRLRSKKQSENLSSPKQRVNKFLGKRKLDEDIHDRLVLNEVILSQIREAYNKTNKTKVKSLLKNAIKGKIVKKYKCLKYLKDVIPKTTKQSVKDRMSIKSSIVARLIQFYEENSTINPGKKAFRKSGTEKRQIQYLNGSRVDLHAKFCAENDTKVSYKTFCRYCPWYCEDAKVTDRDTCACFQHENGTLLVTSLFKEKVLNENSTYKVIQTLVCPKRTEKCLARVCSSCIEKKIVYNTGNIDINKSVNYFQWTTVKETRLSGKTNKPIQVQLTKKQKNTCSVVELIKLFEDQISSLMAHEYRILHQNTAISTLKDNLGQSECLMNIDFSQNYECKYESEVQSVHFGASRTQITLHTGIFCTDKFKQGFSTVSASLKHDACAIIAHLKVSLDHYLTEFPLIKKVHYLSDSPSTQYRNKSIFYLVSQYLMKFYPQIVEVTWNYSEKYHGKNAADGIGATVKRLADDEVTFRKDIPDFGTFYEVLQSKVKNIYISKVTEDDIIEVEKHLPTTLKAFSGTMEVHQFKWEKENDDVVHFNALSCFACPIDRCIHHYKGKLNYLNANEKTQEVIEKLSEIHISNAKPKSKHKSSKAIENAALKRRNPDDVNLRRSTRNTKRIRYSEND